MVESRTTALEEFHQSLSRSSFHTRHHVSAARTNTIGSGCEHPSAHLYCLVTDIPTVSFFSLTSATVVRVSGACPTVAVDTLLEDAGDVEWDKVCASIASSDYFDYAHDGGSEREVGSQLTGLENEHGRSATNCRGRSNGLVLVPLIIW